MREQDARARRATTSRARGTVADWWRPDEGPLAFHYAAELRVLEDALAVDPRWQVLDVGTGPGRFGLWFAAQGCRVVGVDLNPEMRERAAARRRAARGLEPRFEVRRGPRRGPPRVRAGALRRGAVHGALRPPAGSRAGAGGDARACCAPGGRFLFTYVPRESLYGMLGNVYRAAARAHGAGRADDLAHLLASREVARALRARRLRAGAPLRRRRALRLRADAPLRRQPPRCALATALARAEARRWPYHRGRLPGAPRRPRGRHRAAGAGPRVKVCVSVDMDNYQEYQRLVDPRRRRRRRAPSTTTRCRASSTSSTATALRATFFLIGRDAARPAHRALLREICARGHEIGNHSWSHPHNLRALLARGEGGRRSRRARPRSPTRSARGPSASARPPWTSTARCSRSSASAATSTTRRSSRRR